MATDRITQIGLEVIRKGQPTARVSNMSLEILKKGIPDVRVAQAALEVMVEREYGGPTGTLLFMDGFDHYATDDLPKKWAHSYQRFANATISGASPRYTGGRYLAQGTSYNYSTTFTFEGAGNTVILGAALNFDLDVWTDYCKGVYFKDIYGSTLCSIGIEVGGDLEVHRGVWSDPLIDSVDVSSMFSDREWHYWEFRVVCDDTVGEYEVWLDDVSIISGTGVDLNDTTINPTTIYAASIYCGFSEETWIDDLYVDTTTRHKDCRIVSLHPDGAGNYSEWTASAGSNFECVDDTTDITDDTDYVKTQGQGNKDSYTFDDTTLSTEIKGIQIISCARKEGLGGRTDIKNFVRIGPTDFVGDPITLAEGYLCQRTIMNVNPSTLLPWQTSDIDDAEFGVLLNTTTTTSV
jgi:hypothetical protein